MKAILGAIICKGANGGGGSFKFLGDFKTYTRYSWVADEEQKIKKFLGVSWEKFCI